MAARTIENPILNSAFEDPSCHLRINVQRTTDDIAEGRRPNACLVPIRETWRLGGQRVVTGELNQHRLDENGLVEPIRERIALWRQGEFHWQSIPKT